MTRTVRIVVIGALAGATCGLALGSIRLGDVHVGPLLACVSASALTLLYLWCARERPPPPPRNRPNTIVHPSGR